MLCGSAFKNRGVQPMLDAVIEYLPSPLDVPDVEGSNPSNEEEKLSRKASVDEPFAALAFKVAAHPFYGQLTYTRVYSGHASQVSRFLTRLRVRRNVSVSSSRCTPTRRTRLRKSPRVTFMRQSV